MQPADTNIVVRRLVEDQPDQFAVALMLKATSPDCDGLATFDRDFIRAAARIGAGDVAEP